MSNYQLPSIGEQRFDGRVVMTGDVVITGNVTGAGFSDAVQQTSQAALTPAVGIAAAGGTQGTATALTAAASVVTTVSAGTGVKLPATLNAVLYVANRGANDLLVYPPSSAAIDSGSVNVPMTLLPGATGVFVATSATQVYCLLREGIFA